VINGYLYANGLRPGESQELADRGGVLPNAVWVQTRSATPEASVGKEIFRVACRSCHTLDGYNGLNVPLAGLDEDFVFELIGRLQVIRGQMPPFPGTDIERRAVAKYLVSEAEEITLTEGQEVFEKRCGFCHTQEGFRSLYDSLDGYTEVDVIDVLPLLGEMTDEMAPWSGTDEEGRLLAQYLLSWYSGDDDVNVNVK
jgi:mono/diheme cytochrome c family protein